MGPGGRPELSLLALSEHHRDGGGDGVDGTDYSSDGSVSTDRRSLSTASSASASALGPCVTPETSAPGTGFYKSAQWTRDGTTIITSSYDLQIASFLIPSDLLEPRDEPLVLRPHKTLRLAEPTNVVSTAPYYDIRFPNTDHLIVACRDHPLQLYQALSPGDGATAGDDDVDNASQPRTRSGWDVPISSYRLTSPTTEAYLPIHSLSWPHPGTHFYVGTRDLLAEFDITRNGGGPTARLPTIPSRRHIRKGNGVGMRGTASALASQTTADGVPTGLLAAGTWTRWLGLYDMHRAGECAATWSIREAAAAAATGGAGILQTAWSPCGRYLVANERQSTGVLVYDVRVTGRLLGVLAGRDARTHQRLSCDVFPGLDGVGGFEVWAGTRDGAVRVWEGVGNTEGCQWPSWDFSTADGSPAHAQEGTGSGPVTPAVGSVGLHHSGSVVATASGCWEMPGDEGGGPSDDEGSVSPTVGSLSKDRRTQQSSLRLWRIGAAPSSDVP